MRLALGLIVVAGPCFASPQWDATQEDVSILEALGGLGCVLSDEEWASLEAGGHGFEDVQQLALSAQATGQAEQQGPFIVFGADICSIRLPDIESRWSASDERLRQLAPFTRSEYTIGDRDYVDEGCFLTDAVRIFTQLSNGDEVAGFKDYIAFAASGVITGEVRFYSDSLLRTPPGLQVMGGQCDGGANAKEIHATHAYIASEFGPYIRAVQAHNRCGDGGFNAPAEVAMGLQGVDISGDTDDQGPANVTMWLEWTFITLAAGWHEGATATERGTPRPPLCHYQ